MDLAARLEHEPGARLDPQDAPGHGHLAVDGPLSDPGGILFYLKRASEQRTSEDDPAGHRPGHGTYYIHHVL
jgi:hypothetical protein